MRLQSIVVGAYISENRQLNAMKNGASLETPVWLYTKNIEFLQSSDRYLGCLLFQAPGECKEARSFFRDSDIAFKEDSKCQAVLRQKVVDLCWRVQKRQSTNFFPAPLNVMKHGASLETPVWLYTKNIEFLQSSDRYLCRRLTKQLVVFFFKPPVNVRKHGASLETPV